MAQVRGALFCKLRLFSTDLYPKSNRGPYSCSRAYRCRRSRDVHPLPAFPASEGAQVVRATWHNRLCGIHYRGFGAERARQARIYGRATAGGVAGTQIYCR